jgi:ribosomal protein L18
MLAAEEDIANKIVELAKKKDLTVYQTLNDILTQVLRLEEMGLTLQEVVEERWMLERAQEIGLTFTVEHLLYQIADSSYSQDLEEASTMWSELGYWYGKYFEGKNKDPVKAFSEAMELLTFGISDFSLNKIKDDIVVSCLGERYTPGFTELFSLFIENAIKVFGYNLTEKDTSRGIIRIKLKKGG